MSTVECFEAFLSHDDGVSCNDSDQQHHSGEFHHETSGNLFTNTVYLDLENLNMVYQSEHSATHIVI